MMTSSKLVCGHWTDVLEDVNHLPFCEPEGYRRCSSYWLFFHLLIEPQFVDWVVLQTNLYAEQRQEQLQRRDTCGRFY